jgi:hypothetical protein
MDTKNPILNEIRAAREALMAEAGNDLNKLVELLRARQEASGREVVSFPPKPVALAKRA